MAISRLAVVLGQHDRRFRANFVGSKACWWSVKKSWKVGMVGLVSGCFVFGVATVSIIGHVTHQHRLSSWNDSVPMALSTAICLLVISLVMIVVGKAFMPEIRHPPSMR